MCLNCWDEEGRPFKDTEAVRAALPAWREANEFGPLHIVVSDWNLDDDSIAFCRTVNPSQAETQLLDMLAGMSWEERWATAIMADDPNFNPSAHT